MIQKHKSKFYTKIKYKKGIKINKNSAEQILAIVVILR